MYLEFSNAFDSARRDKGFTQEKLAELCGISVGSVSAYGRGESLPGEEVMLALIERLEAPMLGYIYLRSNKVGAAILPEVKMRHLSQSILDLRVEMRHAAAAQDEIDEIGRDGCIEEHEQPKWQRCTAELWDVVRSAFSVLLVSTQKEKSRQIRAAR